MTTAHKNVLHSTAQAIYKHQISLSAGKILRLIFGSTCPKTTRGAVLVLRRFGLTATIGSIWTMDRDCMSRSGPQTVKYTLAPKTELATEIGVIMRQCTSTPLRRIIFLSTEFYKYQIQASNTQRGRRRCMLE